MRAHLHVNSLGFSGSLAAIDFALVEALRLVSLHCLSIQIKRIGETKWINGLHTIRRLVNAISAHGIVNLTQELEIMAGNHHKNKKDFLCLIWLNSHYLLTDVPAQRQMLVTLFINLTCEGKRIIRRIHVQIKL